MPESRRLLAVPFIGKDVPSPAAEFANPEVLVGLTILAYRYDGLRDSDVSQLVASLKDRLKQETGQQEPKRKVARKTRSRKQSPISTSANVSFLKR